MLEILQKASSFLTVPILLVLGWAIYVIWSKQEALYKQQISSWVEVNSTKNEEILRLRDAAEKPSELKSQTDILAALFERKIEESNTRISSLESSLEITMEALKRTIETMDPTFTERQSSLLRMYRHETRGISYAIKSGLTQALKDSRNADTHSLERMRDRIQNCIGLADTMEKNLDVERMISNMHKTESVGT